MTEPREITSEQFVIRAVFDADVLPVKPNIRVLTKCGTRLGSVPRFGDVPSGFNHATGSCMHTLDPDDLRELADLLEQWDTHIKESPSDG